VGCFLRLQPVLLGVLIASAPGCSRVDRVPVYPITGRVLIDGKPLQNATVFLHPPSGDGGLRPVGHTRADGSFDITTYEVGDGAPAGEYRVTVTWNVGHHIDRPEAPVDEPVTVTSPADYANPKKTPLTCKVEKGTNQLQVFTIDSKLNSKRRVP